MKLEDQEPEDLGAMTALPRDGLQPNRAGRCRLLQCRADVENPPRPRRVNPLTDEFMGKTIPLLNTAEPCRL